MHTLLFPSFNSRFCSSKSSTLLSHRAVSRLGKRPTASAEYYLELPQTSRQMTDGNGNAFNLLTFHGPSDICTMSTTEVQAQLLDVTFQDGPVDLQPARFNLSSARTDSSKMRSDIEGMILRLASATVWNTMFLELCPGYSMQPHAAIEHIC
jgi:hypothetical protein